MTDLQAALGLVQLRRLSGFHGRRKKIVQMYNDTFSTLPSLEIPSERPDIEHAWHLYVLRLKLETLSISRSELILELRSRNIGTSVHFIPIHFQQYYRDKYQFHAGQFPVASHEYERFISLPLSPKMTDSDVCDVIAAVEEIMHQNTTLVASVRRNAATV